MHSRFIYAKSCNHGTELTARKISLFLYKIDYHSCRNTFKHLTKKGKSGGGRVIMHIHISESTVYLLSAYDKGEKEMLSNGELEEFVTLIEDKGK